MYLPRTVPAHLKNTAAVIVLHLKDDIITIESVGQIDYPELSPEMQSEIKVRTSLCLITQRIVLDYAIIDSSCVQDIIHV